MYKKIIILTFILLLISSSILIAAEIEVAEIQKLISQGKTEEALAVLENSDPGLNPDLKFYQALLLSWKGEYEQSESILLELITSNPYRLDSYNQLSRIYGWQRKFIKAEEIIKKAQNIEYSSERTALLAQHAEWQGNYFKAKSLIKEAIVKAESSELKAEYEKSLRRINNELQSSLYLAGRAVYIEAAEEDLELKLGVEKLLQDGINLEAAAGANYFKSETNFLFSSGIEIDPPLIPEKNSLSSEFIFYNGATKDKYELNNNYNYLVNPQNRLGVNYNFVKDENNSDYQTLELEYEHRFKKLIMVLKNTSRDDDSGWNPYFAQHIDFYYPRNNYLLNFSLSHYKGEDYVFKVGLQFSDLFSGEKLNLSSLNLWYNCKETSNLDFRMDLK